MRTFLIALLMTLATQAGAEKLEMWQSVKIVNEGEVLSTIPFKYEKINTEIVASILHYIRYRNDVLGCVVYMVKEGTTYQPDFSTQYDCFDIMRPEG
jgi:hypothetical protein